MLFSGERNCAKNVTIDTLQLIISAFYVSATKGLQQFHLQHHLRVMFATVNSHTHLVAPVEVARAFESSDIGKPTAPRIVDIFEFVPAISI